MAANFNKPHLWKTDVRQSIDLYNEWFMAFAPNVFRDARGQAMHEVLATFRLTENLTQIDSETLQHHPQVLSTLRMSTCPPLAVDRLIGLADVPSSLVKRLEKEKKLPLRPKGAELDLYLGKITSVLKQLLDLDLFVWLERKAWAGEVELNRSASIVADRLCGSITNPILRNAQESRQLAQISLWLENHGYSLLDNDLRSDFSKMPPGTYSVRMNIKLGETGQTKASANVPVDVAVMRHRAQFGDFPLLIEAKSAGDFTNTNKRRKEEAQKVSQLRSAYGDRIEYVLLLCGYFDTGYLGYEAAEGIDWVWEHRMDDLHLLGL